MNTRSPNVPAPVASDGSDTLPIAPSPEVEVTADGVKVTVPSLSEPTVITVRSKAYEEPEFDEPGSRKMAFFQSRLSLTPEEMASPSASPAPRLPEGYRSSLVTEYRARSRAHLSATSPRALAATPMAAPAPRAKRQVRFASPADPSTLNWVSIGPSVGLNGLIATKTPVSGRVTGIAPCAGGRRVYVATANGGVWRSDDTGRTWYSLMNAFDQHPTSNQSDSQAVGAIAVDPTNPDRVYVGSGEGTGNLDKYFGVGPVISDDGGLNWRVEPWQGDFGTGFFELAVDPTDPENVLAAAEQGLFQRVPRNIDVPGLPKIKPQSYLLRVFAGAASDAYWDESGLDIAPAWPGAAWNNVATALVTFVYKGKPRVVRYEGATLVSNVWVYEMQPDGSPKQLQPVPPAPLLWANNLLLMSFELGGSQYLVKYDTTGVGGGANNATLGQWADDGTLSANLLAAGADQQWGAPGGAPWTALVPFVHHGVPCFYKYQAGNGAITQLWRWNGNLSPARVVDAAGAPIPVALPNNAILAPITIDGQPLLLVYQRAGGAAGFGITTMFRVEPSGAITQLWQRNNVLVAAGAAVILTVLPKQAAGAGAPRFFLYDPANGQTSLYGFGPEAVPVLLWRRVWTAAANTSFAPFLMGYTWVKKEALDPKPTGDPADPTADPTQHAGPAAPPKASSVVVASNGDETVFYAAFWGKGQVYMSLDHGATFQLLGVFPRYKGRITLAVCPTNTNVVYALASTSEVYRYERNAEVGADQWNLIQGAPPANQMAGGAGWYNLAMAVAPDNVNRIFLGGAATFAAADQNYGFAAPIYRCEVSVSREEADPSPLIRVSMVPTFVGASVHPDMHALAFTPGDGNQLWAGCDGGVFYASSSNDARAAVTETLFASRNSGLSTQTPNSIGQHPSQDAILFIANQDNGAQRYGGDEAWTQAGGFGDAGRIFYRYDAGAPPVPTEIIVTYTHTRVFRSVDRGQTFAEIAGPALQPGEQSQFYSPFITASGLNRISLGSQRVWISDDFGGTWFSIPSNGWNLGDMPNFPSIVSAIAMSPNGLTLYAGYQNGQVFRFPLSAPGTPVPWAAAVRIDNFGVGPLSAFINGRPIPVTSIYVDPTDANAVYVTLGGNLSADPNGWQRVWRFNNPGAGYVWTQSSGAALGTSSLMNTQFNAITGDPNNVNTIYAGADIGIWKSTNNGGVWAPFAEGLPESPVLDLRLFPPQNIVPANGAAAAPSGITLLRAATHGRGVYERIETLAPAPFQRPVQLYVKATVLDRGLYAVQTGVPNPLTGVNVNYYDGYDIKVSAPINRTFPPPVGTPYAYPKPAVIDFTEFAALADNSGTLTPNRDARVYIQVHNRGVVPCESVQINVLLIQVNAGPPNPVGSAVANLPGGYVASIQAGTAVAGGGWGTVGLVVVEDLRLGFPEVISIDIPAASLAQGLYCVLVLLNSAQDVFNPPAPPGPPAPVIPGGVANVAYLVKAEPKAVMKYLVVGA